MGGSLIKVERKIVNIILRQSLRPVSQKLVSSKVPIVVLRQVGVLTNFVRSKFQSVQRNDYHLVL